MPTRPSPILLLAIVAVGVTIILVAAMARSTDDGRGPGATPSAPGLGEGGLTPPPDPGAPRATASPLPNGTMPALVGAIGDSLTRAANANGEFGDQPRHSWVIGDDPDDGIESHLERLRALGADPAVANAAISGSRIVAAPSQAQHVVEAAADLLEGETAYVTFELGANDLCGRTIDDATSPEAYESAARQAFTILRDGLPSGSVLLVLSIPDVPRLREVFGGEPRVLDLYRQYGICPSALGDDADVDGIRERIAAYNLILVGLCDELREAGLDCRHDQAGDPTTSLFGAPFEQGEVSSLDFFHPSLAGQARIAEETWPLTPWGERG